MFLYRKNTKNFLHANLITFKISRLRLRGKFVFNMEDNVHTSEKSPEQIRQLQLKEIIGSVEKQEFIYNFKHKDYYKKGKRTLFWFQTTKELNELFLNNKLNRELPKIFPHI